MSGPFKLKSGNSPLAWDPFGLKAKKELKFRKQLDETTKKIDETSQKAKDLSTKWTAEDAAEKKANKRDRPSGTSDSYMKKHSTGPYAPKTENKTLPIVPVQPNDPAYKEYELPKGKGKFMQTFRKLKKINT